MQVKPEEGPAEPLAPNADTIPKIPAWQYLGATVSLIARKSDLPLTPYGNKVC